MLVRSQWGLFAGAALGALAIPLLEGMAQVVLLLLSTLLVGWPAVLRTHGSQQVLLPAGGSA